MLGRWRLSATLAKVLLSVELVQHGPPRMGTSRQRRKSGRQSSVVSAMGCGSLLSPQRDAKWREVALALMETSR